MSARRDLVLADAERHAVALAARYPVAAAVSAVVYLVADQVLVRLASDPIPEGSTVHCVAQRWDRGQVQLRRAGAWSDWVAAPMVEVAA